MTGEIRELSLVGAFKGVTLKRSRSGALTIDVSALKGVDVTVITASGNAKLQAAETNDPDVINASADNRAYQIGDILPDGWVIAGVSPETNKVFSIEPPKVALKGLKNWWQGEEHAERLRAKGHNNARQPSESELQILYNDRVQKAFPDCYFGFMYWSSTTDPDFPHHARVRHFEETARRLEAKIFDKALVCCVRDEPQLRL